MIRLLSEVIHGQASTQLSDSKRETIKGLINCTPYHKRVVSRADFRFGI